MWNDPHRNRDFGEGAGGSYLGVPSIAGLDHETPVVDLHDPRRYYRRVLVLMDDDERFSLSWSVERVKDRIDRQLWHETLLGRVALISGVLAGITTALVELVSVIRR